MGRRGSPRRPFVRLGAASTYSVMRSILGAQRSPKSEGRAQKPEVRTEWRWAIGINDAGYRIRAGGPPFRRPKKSQRRSAKPEETNERRTAIGGRRPDVRNPRARTRASACTQTTNDHCPMKNEKIVSPGRVADVGDQSSAAPCRTIEILPLLMLH